jgi:hypothetical protein
MPAATVSPRGISHLPIVAEALPKVKMLRLPWDDRKDYERFSVNVISNGTIANGE